MQFRQSDLCLSFIPKEKCKIINKADTIQFYACFF